MNTIQQQRTLDRWLSEHGGIFYKLVRVYALNHHDQEDLFQEIVIQVWKSIPRYNAAAKESTYIYQVALFAAMGWQKKETRRTEHVQSSVEVVEPMVFKPHSPTDPRVDWLYEQISKMGVVDRSLMLLLLEGCSYREIASVLGLTQSNVGSRLTRLKSKIATSKTEEIVE